MPVIRFVPDDHKWKLNVVTDSICRGYFSRNVAVC